MKRTLLTLIVILALGSCKQASELPPIQDGYASSFILPDPVDLTPEDRALIKEQEAEYKDAISQ